MSIWDFREKKIPGIVAVQNVKKLENVTSIVLTPRHVARFLYLKDLKLREIATQPSSAYGEDAYTSLSIKEWIHQIKLRRIDHQVQRVGKRPALDHLVIKILSFLRKFPFS
jgi:hypothetical protein